MQPLAEDEALFVSLKETACLETRLIPNTWKTYNFNINEIASIVKSKPIKPQPGKPLTVRFTKEGSLIYRLRFVNFPPETSNENMDLSSWYSKPTSLPSCTFAEINGKILDFRKKKRWGKDYPTDITDHLQEGVNEIKVAYFETDSANQGSVAFAVEVLETKSHSSIHRDCNSVQKIPAEITKSEIMARLKASDNLDHIDSEIAYVNPETIVVSVVCPISQTSPNLPVRGKNCAHVECFDLDAFLESRPKYIGGISVTDAWNCPICTLDCRPQNLLMDGFIHSCIGKLKQEGRDVFVKSIEIRSDGKWKPFIPKSLNKAQKGKRPDVIDLSDD